MQDFRRTRIVATVGPASGSVAMLTRLIGAGLTVARLNFSHGTHEQHKDYIAHLRAASRRAGKRVAILQDLQGPKIRVGNIDPITLANGEKVVLVAGEKGLDDEIPITLASFVKDIQKGERILLNDGFIELLVTGKKGKKVHAEVIQGGPLSAHKGVNFPDSHITGDFFTDKDHEDLLFGIAQGVDYIALSFVENAKNVQRIRAIVEHAAKRAKMPAPQIIAKIERKEAIEQFVNILPVVDGIMVARGDLGLEVPFEEVPILQKEIVNMCRLAGKPAIVATHMLESMTKNIRPTRAEVSDVANAVIDHADAVMLSGETASGEYPYVVVQTMDRVVRETEHSYLDDMNPASYIEDTHAIFAQTVHRLAASGTIAGVAVSALQGELLRKVGVYRPQIPIFIFCHDEAIARQQLLRSGAVPVVVPNITSANIELIGHRELLKQKLIKKTESIAFVHQSVDGKLHLTIK